MFLMCLRSAQVCSDSLLWHFIFQILLSSTVPSPETPGASLWHFLPPDPPPPRGKNHGFDPDMTCFLSEKQDIPIYFRIYLRKP